MLQYDLTQTALINSESLVAVPTEGELLVLMVSLMLLKDFAYADLRERALILTHDNLGHVAKVMEERLGPLLRDIGTGTRFRQRLEQLVGMRITRLG